MTLPPFDLALAGRIVFGVERVDRAREYVAVPAGCRTVDPPSIEGLGRALLGAA